MEKRILVIADTNRGAFERVYQGLKKYCREWKVEIHYLQSDPIIKHDRYPVVLYLCDWLLNPIFESRIPQEKLILFVRHENLDHWIYDADKLKEVVCMIATSSLRLYENYSQKHPNVRVAPGGVDTELFSFKRRHLVSPSRIGWAGEAQNHGREYRGIGLIEEACSTLGFIFNSATDQWKSLDEMIQYYHNDIDIYVDMSEETGKQEGLLEAGSCGCPIIASDTGIARELITHGVNGFISDRNAQSLITWLRKIESGYTAYSENIRRSIEYDWSWELHALNYEILFEECSSL